MCINRYLALKITYYLASTRSLLSFLSWCIYELGHYQGSITMPSQLEIKLLADCPQQIPQLAELWFKELGQEWIPGANIERAIQTYETHINTQALPLTFVATHQDEVIAMVSLRENDGIRKDLGPWLGGLIVHPQYRRKKIGETLIHITKQCAKAMDYSKLYLFALDPTLPTWYHRLGWRAIGMDKFYHHPVTVMEILV